MLVGTVNVKCVNAGGSLKFLLLIALAFNWTIVGCGDKRVYPGTPIILKHRLKCWNLKKILLPMHNIIT